MSYFSKVAANPEDCDSDGVLEVVNEGTIDGLIDKLEKEIFNRKMNVSATDLDKMSSILGTINPVKWELDLHKMINNYPLKKYSLKSSYFFQGTLVGIIWK